MSNLLDRRVQQTEDGGLFLVIEGRPQPKKSRTNLVETKRGPKLLQNPAFREWEASALLQLRRQWGRLDPLTVPISISIAFFEHPQQRFDLAGVFQAVCDVLEKSGVVRNDRQFRRSELMQITRDRRRPRVEIHLHSVPKTQEEG